MLRSPSACISLTLASLVVQFIQFGFIQEDLQIPFLCICGLGWTFILSIMAGSTKEYSYCVTGAEDECLIPEELFPIEEMAHEMEEVAHEIEEVVHEMEHNIEEAVHEMEHEFEVVVHDLNVALHLEEPDTNGSKEEQMNDKNVDKTKEEEEALMK